ncbi:hypothetical protein HY837_03875 [archaeon]|nr:hypothetical protein [archaeon]
MLERIIILFSKKPAYVSHISRKKIVCEEFKKTLSELTDHDGLNFGDYELIHFKSYLEIKQKQDLVNFLKQVHAYSKNLPTVGVELGYSTVLSKDFLDYLNDGKYCFPNSVPRSENHSNQTSEIRVLPTNPYALRWLLEEISPLFPEISSTVQVCVENVDTKKMPFIFLALYFSNPSCILPPCFKTDKDMIGFPGAYVGQTATVYDSLKCRAQTNYLVIHSDSINEMADACFYAAKLHSIDKEKFVLFEEELREFLGFGRIRKNIEGEIWVKEFDDLRDLLNKDWPGKYTNDRSPYQMPPEFIENSIKKVKNYFNINDPENLSQDSITQLAILNRGVKQIIEKYIDISPYDIMYRASINDLL